MSDITNFPRQNNFVTQLSQSISAGATTIPLVDVPSFSLSPGQYCIGTIDPGLPTQENVRITQINVNGVTVDQRGLPNYEGGASTAQSHTVSTDNFVISFDVNTLMHWRDVINSKLNESGGTLSGTLGFSGTTHYGLAVVSLTQAEIDALTGVPNGAIVYNKTDGELNVRQGGSWQPLATGSVQPDASETVAGKVEKATDSEGNMGTATGGTGAFLFLTPLQVATIAQNNPHIYAVAGGSSSAYTLTLTPAVSAYVAGQGFIFRANHTNTGAVTLAVNGLSALDVKTNGNALQAGQIVQDKAYLVIYNGTDLDLVTAPNSLLTTKGDLLTRTSSADSRLAVGATDGMSLQVDSSASTGLAYKVPTKILGISNTTQTISASATETTFYSTSVTGNFLGASGVLRGKVFFVTMEGADGADTITIRIKLGSTTIVTITVLDGTATNKELDFVIWNTATNAQQGMAWFADGTTTGTTNFATGTGAVDTTANQTLAVTIQLGGSVDGDSVCTAGGYILELLQR